jgi:membrane fusion protein (multidrug efflux system)
MFANVELILDVRRNVLTVPEGSILTSPGGPQVVTVVDGEGGKVAQFIPVELGLRAKGYVEVRPLKGVLPEQQSVVASGVGALILFPGARVEPRPLRAEFLVNGSD